MNVPRDMAPTRLRDTGSLFHPKSIAVIGATDEQHRLTSRPIRLLEKHGFGGAIYPVHPTRTEVAGRPCYQSMRALPEAPELALVLVSGSKVLPILQECRDRGTGSALILASGISEDDMKAIGTLSTTSGMAILGPNSNGLVSSYDGLVVGIQPGLLTESLHPGPLSLAFQSGAMASAVMHRLSINGVGYSRVASCGNEVSLSVCDLAADMLQDRHSLAVLMFLEGLVDGEAFIELCGQARRAGKALVVAKVGHSELSRSAVFAHTGKMGGSRDAYRAVFERYGVIEVENLEDMIAVAELLSIDRPVRGPRLGIVSGSGGLNTWLIDRAEACGLDLPSLSAPVLDLIKDLLPLSEPMNPVDMTGMGSEQPSVLRPILSALAASECIDVLVVGLNVSAADVGRERAGICIDVARASGKPLVVFAPGGDLPEAEMAMLADGGVRCFSGMDAMLHGLASCARLRAIAPSIVPDHSGTRGLQKAPTPESVPDLLRRYGIPYVQEIDAVSPASAIDAAVQIGFPVAVKARSVDVAHRTDVGAVVLDVSDSAGIELAWETVRLAVESVHNAAGFSGVIVQPMAEPGLEMIVSSVRDATFGQMAVVGFGGTLVETLRDFQMSPCPVGTREARAMIDRLRNRSLLVRDRSGKAYDMDALAEVVARLSALATDYSETLDTIELNPVMVGELGARVVDVLATDCDGHTVDHVE